MFNYTAADLTNEVKATMQSVQANHSPGLDSLLSVQLNMFLFTEAPSFTDIIESLEAENKWLESRFGYLQARHTFVKKDEAATVQMEMRDGLKHVSDSLARASAFDRLYNWAVTYRDQLEASVSPDLLGSFHQLKDGLRKQSQMVRNLVTEQAGIRKRLEDKIKEIRDVTADFTVEFTQYLPDSQSDLFPPYRK